MSLTLATPLPAIAFSKNPLWLKPISDDYLTAAAVIAINFFEFDAAVANGDTAVLNWTDNEITMTAAAVPDGSGNQFPSGDGSNGYVTGLVAWFQKNYFIDSAFVVSVNTAGAHPRLIFTARESGTLYNFLITTSTFGVLTAGVDSLPKANFMHHVEIWIDNLAGGYDQCFTANVPLDENPVTGQTSIDIHETLHAFLKHDRPVLSALYQQCVNSIRAYFVKYAQYFGAIPAIQAVTKTANQVIALGGIGMQPNLLRDMVLELCPVVGDATQNRFLRQGSKNKLVTQAQPEWLTFINFGVAAVTVALEITIHNADTTTVVFNSVTGIVINPLEKYQFAAGFTQLDILSRQSLAEQPVYYTARIKSAGVYLTDVYAFVVDYQYREWPRYIVYENGYGAFQTVATVGKAQTAYDRTKTDAQLTVDRHVAALNGEFIESNILIQQKQTLNIGYDRSGKRNTALLRDLLLSHTAFLYTTPGTLIPIGFNTQTLKDAMDGQNVYANAIEYFLLYQEEVWTEDQPLADDSLTDLLIAAGVPVAALDLSGDLVIDYGDPKLAIVGGQEVYTNAHVLGGKTGYRIFSTQLGEFLRTEDVTYDKPAGAFTILIPGFVLAPGEQLIVVINGIIVVESTYSDLSVVGGQQVYTNYYDLGGRTGYRIYTTQTGGYLRAADVAYNPTDGSFTILVPFLLAANEQLIIWPKLIAP